MDLRSGTNVTMFNFYNLRDVKMKDSNCVTRDSSRAIISMYSIQEMK